MINQLGVGHKEKVSFYIITAPHFVSWWEPGSDLIISLNSNMYIKGSRLNFLR